MYGVLAGSFLHGCVGLVMEASTKSSLLAKQPNAPLKAAVGEYLAL